MLTKSYGIRRPAYANHGRTALRAARIPFRAPAAAATDHARLAPELADGERAVRSALWPPDRPRKYPPASNRATGVQVHGCASAFR